MCDERFGPTDSGTISRPQRRGQLVRSSEPGRDRPSSLPRPPPCSTCCATPPDSVAPYGSPLPPVATRPRPTRPRLAGAGSSRLCSPQRSPSARSDSCTTHMTRVPGSTSELAMKGKWCARRELMEYWFRYIALPAVLAYTQDDPEKAHKLAVTVIGSGIAPVDRGVDDEVLETEVSLSRLGLSELADPQCAKPVRSGRSCSVASTQTRSESQQASTSTQRPSTVSTTSASATSRLAV